MSLVDEHFQRLREEGPRRGRFVTATITPVGNGSSLVRLDGFALRKGWKPDKTTVYFLVPAGYPVARPDTFWTDGDVELESGAPAMNTGQNQQPGVPAGLKWFSWHPTAWNPSRDSLLTWVAAIRHRFEDLR